MILGIWAYAFQVYGDFSDYSYMAWGMARLLGIDVASNLSAPYLTHNLSGCWKQWHISLSEWLDEYIFTPVPLALRRLGMRGVIIALWTTFIVSGLWQGKDWDFFAYACLHALGLTIFTLTARVQKDAEDFFGDAVCLQALAASVTFQFVCLGYLLIRSTSLPRVFPLFLSLRPSHWGSTPGLRLASFALPVIAFQWILAAPEIRFGSSDNLSGYMWSSSWRWVS